MITVLHRCGPTNDYSVPGVWREYMSADFKKSFHISKVVKKDLFGWCVKMIRTFHRAYFKCSIYIIIIFVGKDSQVPILNITRAL